MNDRPVSHSGWTRCRRLNGGRATPRARNAEGGLANSAGEAAKHRARSEGVGTEGGGLPPWKRALDVGCIVLAVPVLLPLLGLIALAIKCVSPGPILYRHERVGYRGRRFVCFKFRSMAPNADSSVHRAHVQALLRSQSPMIKMDAARDGRIFPLGSLFRATGLDELPQLYNVLRGEMSLVGPRPCLPYEYDGYAPCHRKRFRAVPGLTGLWQVRGKNQTTFRRMIALDVCYARHQSLWLDLRIIAQTVAVLFAQIIDTVSHRGSETPATETGAASPSQKPSSAPHQSITQTSLCRSH
jgi:lipopolysaccharide/colanic/teichoic acid biosynthesis glycosyltransferase